MIKKLILFSGLLLSQIFYAQNILGIDVSHHQGSINWTLVANDGKVFAYCKSTEGFTYDDPNFQTYMTNGHNAGVVMGAYHFARPDNNSAIDEANHFLSVAGNYIGDGYLPPVLDFEDPNSSTHLDQIYSSQYLTNWIQTWLNRVESVSGVKPVIYTNSHYANFLQSSLNTYGLWIAKPGTSPTTPPTNMGIWNDWQFKQYSWQGNVNGISGYVDLDVFNGTTSDFLNLTALDNFTQQPLNIYPNPVENILNLKFENNLTIKQLDIYDSNGRLIKSFSGNYSQIPVNSLQPGFYILHIQTKNGRDFRLKFIKKQGVL